MNLPSTAIDFLVDFLGLYHGLDKQFAPHTNQKLPMIHCYCFGPKDEDGDPEGGSAREQVCQQLSEKLGHEILPSTPEVEIFDVRDVAPNKRQFCATFRLPPEVAFRARDGIC